MDQLAVNEASALNTLRCQIEGTRLSRRGRRLYGKRLRHDILVFTERWVSSGGTLSHLAKELGIAAVLLSKWRHRDDEKTPEALNRKSSSSFVELSTQRGVVVTTPSRRTHRLCFPCGAFVEDLSLSELKSLTNGEVAS
jgi:hypothetical protein